MESQIKNVKVLLEKTKEIKEELKVEILTVDDEIDEYIQNLSTLIDTASQNYDAKVKLLTAQTDNLAISKVNQLDEFEKTTFDGLKANDVYKKVQDMLDKKIEEQNSQKAVLEKQLIQYEGMDPSERLEL